MLLIVTGQDDVTADLVVEKLKKANARFLRFNTESYPSAVEISVKYASAIKSGSLRILEKEVAIGDIDTVWFRKPNPPTISNTIHNAEARSFAQKEIEATLSGFYRLLTDAFWVSNPDAIRRA